MKKKIPWKIIPWNSDMKSKETIELVDWLTNEGYIIELDYFDDKDNGRLPILVVWDNRWDS